MLPVSTLNPFERVGTYHDPSRFGDPGLISWLQETGTGFIRDGFLRIIDGGAYHDTVARLLGGRDDILPVAASAFADIFFQYERSLYVARAHRGVIQHVSPANAPWVSGILNDPALETQDGLRDHYDAAEERLGRPTLDECFGYAPLLVLGGSPKPENLHRVDLTTHLELIVQAGGPLTTVAWPKRT